MKDSLLSGSRLWSFWPIAVTFQTSSDEFYLSSLAFLAITDHSFAQI
jgi:hypothetical protein